jgi:hypothetical protein
MKGENMAMKSEIEVELQAHSAWRQHFKDILNGRSSFDLNEIRAHDQCVLGKWLINEGRRMIPAELHNEICRVHQDFHKIASEIIQKIKDKRYVEAHEDISLEGPLNLTSIKLKSLLVKLSFKEPPAEPVVAIENEKSSNTQE